MTELKELFDTVIKLQKHKDNGEFNVFHAIGFKTQETMHSKFIATMLNPNEKHGKSTHFLELFLDHTNLEFEPKNVKVHLEKRAGRRSMDITVENNKKIIIIENKVWATDQPLQLEDYYKSCIETGKKVDVIYLTPYGHSPSSESLGETLTKDQVKCISYEKEILPWIDKCAKDADGRLKHSLEMYCESVRVLINRDKYMNEIFEELKNKEKLKLAIDVYLALHGRNYIKEFPDSIKTFIQCIHNTNEAVNPYPEENRLTICDDNEFDGWDIVFDEDRVFAENRKRDINPIEIFNPNDISNPKLQSLILEDENTANGWVYDLIQDIKRQA